MTVFAKIASFFRRAGSEYAPVPVALAKSTRERIEELRLATDFVEPRFPIRFIDDIEKAALITPDLDACVEVRVNLANTGIKWKPVGVRGQRARAAIDADIIRFYEDNPNLRNQLLRQIVIGGALSAEVFPTPGMDDVDVRLVPVQSIRFRKEYVDRERFIFVPYQRTKRGTYLRLNPYQYTYEAIQTAQDSPYGIPPFFSTLSAVDLQHHGRENLGSVLRKWGLLGFIRFIKNKLVRRPTEKDDVYEGRLQKHLADVGASLRDMNETGFVATYDDTKVEHESVINERGFEAVWQINEEQIFTGAKVPPSLAGRSYSRTETYAEVEYTGFIRGLGNGRFPVKKFERKALMLYLHLRGHNFTDLEGEWGPDAAIDKTKDAEARKTDEETLAAKIQNLRTLLADRIITLDQYAQALGYESAAGEKSEGLPATKNSRVASLADYRKKKARMAAAGGALR